jgi:DNA-binding beta-propeller fold protein YncE
LKRAALLLLSLGLLALPAAAPAADSVYWTNLQGSTGISYANLDGSGGGGLSTAGANVSDPQGIALDPAAGRVYWSSTVGTVSISWANLDGSGGGDLNTTGATLVEPKGVGIDKATGRIYWANGPPEEGISWANLDGSGGGDLNTTGATMDAPAGIAVDRTGGRVYWANFELGSNKVSYANLDGSGGGDLDQPSTDNGTAVALDPATGRVYWGELNGEISYLSPDGTGGGFVNTAGATVTVFLRGIAIDPVTNRVFWVSEQIAPGISFAALNGSGGGDLVTSGAIVNQPHAIALLRAPSGTAVPAIGGRAAIRSTLTCSQGGWAADLPGSQFYRAPRSFAYRWLKGGAEIASAVEASYRPAKPGSYACQVTATNHAGSNTQASAAVQVRAGTASAAGVALVKGGRALLKLRCGGIPCEGVARLKRGKASIGKANFTIAARKKKTVRVKLKQKGMKLLAKAARHRLKVKLAGSGVKKRTVTLKPAGG